ncbi:hypothetical protein [Prevotella nigrescens]|uniref:hypothetical protein n=1 Tax=Prevotella nigrescens TaxID=28133 RepID=UPI0028DCA629|nr:hypothetical protein [Prevotella nigrescens]
MKENQVSKRLYVTPEAEVVVVKMNCHLLDASVPGGHHSANNDEELHAKEAIPFDEDEFSTSKNMWKD